MKKIARRKFLKDTTFAGIATSLMSEKSIRENFKLKSGAKKVIVGGAGIAGLCCAYELMRLGHDVTVLEGSGRHGGHIMTAKDGLSDGLYGDYGAEHITKPGYERFWEYTREFNLEVLPYPRRKNIMRNIDGKFYTEEQLRNPDVLKTFGFNEKEIEFLGKNLWWELRFLYVDKYLDKFKDEYQPFGVGYDEYDLVGAEDFFKKEGASKMALSQLPGNESSALFVLWYSYIEKFRGVGHYPRNVFRLKGGNQTLPDTFAKKLGKRVWLACKILSIDNGKDKVVVKYQQHNEEKELSADYYVNCIPLPTFKSIPVTPAFSKEKQFVIDNVSYESYQRFVFQASSKFWEDDGLSINIEGSGHPDLWNVWASADEVNTHRAIMLGTGPGGVSPQRALAAFRQFYKGKDTIETVVSKDWTKDSFAPNCERNHFPKGQLKKYWPQIMLPEGRIHFAGAYADNLNWGMEAATRSANRAAKEINEKA